MLWLIDGESGGGWGAATVAIRRVHVRPDGDAEGLCGGEADEGNEEQGRAEMRDRHSTKPEACAPRTHAEK